MSNNKYLVRAVVGMYLAGDLQLSSRSYLANRKDQLPSGSKRNGHRVRTVV